MFFVVACNGNEPIGICSEYDAFHIIMESKWNRVGVDCLRGSGLMRIFLPTNEYVIKPDLHIIVKKRKFAHMRKLTFYHTKDFKGDDYISLNKIKHDKCVSKITIKGKDADKFMSEIFSLLMTRIV